MRIPPSWPIGPTWPIWSACGEAPLGAHPTARPLVIALHASGSSARQWRALAARLEPQGATAARAVTGYRVLAVDLHDHGVGPAWTTGGASRAPLTLEDEAALVAPLLAEAGRVSDGGGAHLVGHSYGGAVALKVACQHPQHVRSLVLYEPVVFRLLLDDPASHAETHEVLAVAAEMQSRLERDDSDGAARHFVDYWSGSGSWQEMPEGARAAVALRMPIVMQHFGALLNERQQVAALQRFGQLAVPTLVLSGERTVATARRIASRLRTLLAGAVHETLPGLGHMGPVTHAELVAERIAVHLQAPARAPDPMAFPLTPALRHRDLLTVD
ncbi:MAG: alpha/beta hydrolase [Burkholderiales bacterium]|nr:alpha/beta hydrolase [Burkholderiales bacterium]